MSNHENDRVLNRRGCRELTQQEVEKITGSAGGVSTTATNLPTTPVAHPDWHFDE